jgi:rhodanese-related sulfurtransferase
MHTPDFAQQIQRILSVYGASQIALICATGGRSAYVADILSKNGISGVWDVPEGMFGNGAAPGWIARGLNVVPLGEAMARYKAATVSWEN